MKRTFLHSTITFILLLVAQFIFAEIKLPAIISSNMVLQRNTTIALWGWADPKESIDIETSWLDTPLKTKADKDGNWRIEVKTTNSIEPQSIEIQGENSEIKLDNVLFGEVWLCS